MFHRYFLAALFLCAPVVFAQETVSLGEIDFPTSALPAAQRYFIDGVLALHSFEYESARAAFQKAQLIDPNFALAYWGEAMTYNHPLWQQQDLKSAQHALEKFGSTADKRIERAQTEKEKGFMKAVNILFGQGSKAQRDQAYAHAMNALYRTYPDDDEIALFYSLSLLGKNEGVRDFKNYMQAGALAEEVSKRKPSHPGALHYALHSYDDPIHAPLGLRAARLYPKVSHDAPHALHMPSHIFLALGMWDDVVASNIAAWQAGLKNHTSDLHVLHWLIYGYLQQQDYQNAYALTKLMQQLAKEYPSAIAQSTYALAKAAYVTESKDFASDLKPLDISHLDLVDYVTEMYTDALIELNTSNDNASLATSLEILKTRLVGMTASIDTLRLVNILLLELQAQIQLHQGKTDDALHTLEKAAQLEDDLPLAEGPPFPVQPSHELLADVLYGQADYLKAYKEYQTQLERTPNRTLSRLGLEKTKEKLKAQGVVIPEEMPYFNKLMLEEGK